MTCSHQSPATTCRHITRSPHRACGGTRVDNGGGWSRDGRTLPGVLDIEWNPYGAACYGKSQAGMATWIRDFLNRCKARTGRDAVIHTAISWWTQCTRNYAGFGATNPLWIARYNTTPGTLPVGRPYYTMWQYTSSGPIVGDHSKFNGAYDRPGARHRLTPAHGARPAAPVVTTSARGG